MTVGEVASTIEEWAPRSIAWERDNVGLQVGDRNDNVRAIIVVLDATPESIREATRKGANLVVSHHPLFFKPVLAITDASPTTQCIRMLLHAGINLYSAHTNLDFSEGGTSFALAATLGLQRATLLRRSYEVLRKIVTYVPVAHVERVADAMARAGAGRIGNYDYCSFRLEGEGTFRAGPGASPFTGSKESISRTREIRLEMLADQWNTDVVVKAMKDAHPYEEVAHEVYPMENKSVKYGAGIVGDLERSMTLRNFLGAVRRRLMIPHLRYTGNPQTIVRRVAACGGSGSDLLQDAVEAGADAFVTADIRYHTFHEAKGRIALIDAGHYETEYPVVQQLAARLRNHLAARKIPVRAFNSTGSTNPVRYF